MVFSPKGFKDILPIYINMVMVEKIDLTNLPSEVISNIASFMLEKPEYLRLKHNEALKRIQRKYMIEYLGPTRKRRRRKTTLEFAIMRNNVPFSRRSISHIITKQENKILNMFYNEFDSDDSDEDDEPRPRLFLSVNAKACARMSDTQYEGNTFSFCDFTTPLIRTDGNHLWHNLIEIAEHIEEEIQVEHERFNFDTFGIQLIEFKLVLK